MSPTLEPAQEESRVWMLGLGTPRVCQWYCHNYEWMKWILYSFPVTHVNVTSLARQHLLLCRRNIGHKRWYVTAEVFITNISKYTSWAEWHFIHRSIGKVYYIKGERRPANSTWTWFLPLLAVLPSRSADLGAYLDTYGRRVRVWGGPVPEPGSPIKRQWAQAHQTVTSGSLAASSQAR